MITFVCCVLLLLLYFTKNIWLRKKSSLEPPVLAGRLPIIGHAYKLFGDNAHTFKTIMSYGEESAKLGGVSCTYMGPKKMCYLITDPEDSLTVSNECLDKSYVYTFLKPFLGNGLITAPELIWRKHRKLLNPAFSQFVLNGFIPTFNSQARKLVNEFLNEVGEPFDHEDLLRIINLETICFTAIGMDEKELSDLQKPYILLISQILEQLIARFKRVWLHPDMIFRWSTLKKQQDDVAKSFLELSKKILQVKRKYTKHFSNDTSSKLKPFMELILELTNKPGLLTDEEVREEIDSIVAAGHDTSATILTFVFTVLGSKPDVQRKVYEEVATIFGDTDSDLNKDDLSKLVYTEAVIKETIRLYPIAPIIGRDVNKQVKLKNYVLEPNNSCFIFVSMINTHSMWGPDADQFRPERWLDPTGLPELDYFGGFGLGKRGCIGKVYAMMSMKITTAYVIRKYIISSDITKMVLKWDMMSRPDHGHFITLKLRSLGN